MHNIEHYTYPKDVDKKKVQKELDRHAAEEDYGEGCTGLGSSIRWYENKVYENRDEAEKAIEKMDNGWYDQLAVLYKSNKKPRDNKIKELNDKCRLAYEEYIRRDNIKYPQTVTSTYIGCKNCGSRLARTLLNSNRCPVCHNDLRPEHMLKTVAAAEKKHQKILHDIAEYEKKKGTPEINWLVKIEYHT